MNLTGTRALIQRGLDLLRNSLVVALLAALGRVGVTDRAMTLAAQAFTSVLPLLILITALPTSGPIERAVNQIGSEWLSLDPSGPVSADPATASFGVAGIVMTIIGATSFSRALDRMYADAWRCPKLGMAGWWRWPLVIAAMVIGITVEVYIVRGFDYPGRFEVIETVLSFVFWTLIWTLITRLLTAGRVDRISVWATGAATGLAVSLFFYATEIAFSHVLSGTEVRFGALGIVFAVISWLFLYAWIVVAVAVIVAVVRTHSRAPISITRSPDHAVGEGRS